MNVPGLPATNAVLAALVKTVAESTVSMKVWVAAVPTPLDAVIVKLYGLADPETADVPTMMPLPPPLSWKLTPRGRLDVESAGDGDPVAVTTNENGEPDTSVTVP